MKDVGWLLVSGREGGFSYNEEDVGFFDVPLLALIGLFCCTVAAAARFFSSSIFFFRNSSISRSISSMSAAGVATKVIRGGRFSGFFSTEGVLT